ncbi:MAG: OadG family protein [Clostridiales bacterium]|nr:OadG family protein [Clostridiales bacterium]
MDYSNLFVCLMGIGTVFFGLICIILLVTLMSFVCRKTEQKTTLAPAAAPAGVSKAGIGPELIAAVSAAIAEEMGTDISAIRIISMKQI